MYMFVKTGECINGWTSQEEDGLGGGEGVITNLKFEYEQSHSGFQK